MRAKHRAETSVSVDEVTSGDAATMNDRVSNSSANFPVRLLAELSTPEHILDEEMRFLTPAELSKLADAIDPRYRGFVILAGYSGLRLGELLALRWGHIDVERRQVEVHETLSSVSGQISFGPPKTRAAIRTMSVPGFVIDALVAAADPSPDPSQLVFASPEGYPIRPSLFRQRFWHPAVDAAGLTPLRIHDLRHTAVALWIAAGGHPKQIAARAGHTSVSVVLDRYGHLLPNHDDALMQALENLGAPAR